MVKMYYISSIAYLRHLLLLHRGRSRVPNIMNLIGNRGKSIFSGFHTLGSIRACSLAVCKELLFVMYEFPSAQPSL